MKAVHPSYTFVASTKTITLTGLNIDQDQLLLIVNATRGVQYFNFADSSLRGTVTSGANTTIVLTDASTTGHSNSDALVIYYDDQASTQAVSGTVTANPGTGAFTVSGTVGLDANSLSALENITVTVGAAVSVSNFPATQTVAGTVTANLGLSEIYDDGGDALKINIAAYNGSSSPIGVNDNSGLPVKVVGGSVTIGSLPAISGTVTANVGGIASGVTIPVRLFAEKEGESPTGQEAAGISVIFNKGEISRVVGNDPVNSFPVQVLNSVTIGSLPAISGTVTVGSLPTLTPQLPRVTFIDGSGSVTTANTAVTVFASSSTRSYLLVQVTTGSAFVNVGATATTVNGISLTAGQGYAWETTIPQGVVSLISTTTSSRYVAKQA